MRRIFWAVVVLIAAGIALYLASVTVRIQEQSILDEARAADVIIIMGAAEYRGRPSPVLRARLDHGLDLFRRGLAPRIMTTGGAGGDPVHTEGEVGRAYLVRNGVPSEAIIVEAEGESTVHTLVAAAEMMERMNLKSAVVVSDGYHIFRAKKILQDRGLQVFGSPRPEAPRRPALEWWLYARQAIGYFLWRIGIPI